MTSKSVSIPQNEIADFLNGAVSAGFVAGEFKFSGAHNGAATASPLQYTVAVKRTFADGFSVREYLQGQGHDWVNEALADLKASLFGAP